MGLCPQDVELGTHLALKRKLGGGGEKEGWSRGAGQHHQDPCASEATRGGGDFCAMPGSCCQMKL